MSPIVAYAVPASTSLCVWCALRVGAGLPLAGSIDTDGVAATRQLPALKPGSAATLQLGAFSETTTPMFDELDLLSTAISLIQCNPDTTTLQIIL